MENSWGGTRAVQAVRGREVDFSFCTVYLCNAASGLPIRDQFLLSILLTASRKSVICKWLNIELRITGLAQ